MRCWRCGSELEEIGQIKFRSECSRCGSDQHVCVNCRHYAPGRANDCFVPDIEPVSDKEKRNFCDAFRVKEEPSGGSNKESAQGSFNDLFRDT